jgi:DNA-binding CsgD family transcriptional regulator
MTVQFFSAPLNYEFLFTQSQKRSSPRSSKKNRQSSNSSTDSGATHETALWAALLAAMPIGVMVLTDLLKLVYRNEQAKALCDRLQKDNAVPDIVRGLCQRLMAEEVVIPEPLIMEYQGAADQFFRLQVKWMNSSGKSFLVVFLEDCHMLLQDELKIEQAKYDLTVREAEVWCLLRQRYSYQEISELLKITLNTVKTHAKNIYAKRKNSAEEQKIWYSR